MRFPHRKDIRHSAAGTLSNASHVDILIGIIDQGIALVDIKHLIINAMHEHVHPRKVVHFEDKAGRLSEISEPLDRQAFSGYAEARIRQLIGPAGRPGPSGAGMSPAIPVSGGIHFRAD